VTSGSGAEPFCELWVNKIDWFLSGDLSLGRVADRKPFLAPEARPHSQEVENLEQRLIGQQNLYND